MFIPPTTTCAMSQPVSITSQPSASSLTLSQAWAQAQRDIQQTQSPPPSTTPDTLLTLHSTALHSLLTLRSLVHTAAVLSDNEQLAELPTSSLRYVLVPSLLAGVLMSWPGMDGRRGRLEQCMSLWQQLVASVDGMDGLTEAEERRWRQVKAAILLDSDGEDTRGSGPRADSDRMDAGQQRQDKIARFKQQREWQQQIEAYEAKQQQQQQQRAKKQHSHNQTGTNTTNREDGEDEAEDADEEASRRYWLLRLRVAINVAMDELLTGQQELHFLRERQAREADPQLRREREQQEEEQRRANDGHKPSSYTISSAAQLHTQPIPANMQAYLHPLPQPTSTSNGRTSNGNTTTSMGGSVVTTLDELMGRGRREDVFRVVNGPTMSVEEWAEQEMREGRLPTPQQSWRAASREERGYVGTGDRENGTGGAGGEEEDDVGERGGESDEQRLDAKRAEEREWDNWKDDHERGAGNRKR